MFSSLARRHRTDELMDDPTLDAQRHRHALAGLRRINRWSFAARALWGAIRPLLSRDPGRPTRLLDVACGGGDVPLGLWSLARRAGVELAVEGCDISETALEEARSQARRAGASVRFFRMDAMAEQFPEGYDIVSSSLFLHHLETEVVVGLLRRMARAADVIVVNDLVRSRAGLLLAYAGTRVLSRSSIVHVDGVLSVKAAFLPRELLSLAERAGLAGATVRRAFPCRLLFLWKRSAGS